MAPIRCCFDQTAVWHSDAAKGPSTPSFDHLVGSGEQGRRDGDVEQPSGLVVDDQFELARLHHRQIDRLPALEDAAGIDADLPKHIRKVGPVAHEPADVGKLTLSKCCWKRVARRQIDKLDTAAGEKAVAAHEQGIGPRTHKCCESRIDLAAGARVEYLDLQAK